MSAIAILGSGFGLYGYLPALVQQCEQSVVMPARYREKFARRKELAQFASCVRWVSDEQTALAESVGAVLALCPAQQTRWLSECMINANLKFLILEKPLASDPETAGSWLNRLAKSGKTIRIAYLFRYLDWARDLAERIHRADLQGVTIHWRFMAHHFCNDLDNWKRDHDQGGGALRFYGIHLIALLAEMGYRTTNWSVTTREAPREFGRWQAELSGPGLPNIKLDVDSASHEQAFTVSCKTLGEQTRWTLADPFSSRTGARCAGDVDARVPVLAEFCKSAWDHSDQPGEMYQCVVDLWQSVEDCDQPELSKVAA